MATLRDELIPILTALLEQSAVGGDVDLDAIGASIGALAVSTDEIEALFRALEAEGRTIVAPTGGAERYLKQVVFAVRKLRGARPERPTLAEVAEAAELEREQVLLGLALLRVMQR